MFRKSLLLLLPVILLLALIIPGTYAQDELSEEVLFLPFIPNIQFSPVYVAMEKGYFAEEGINVTVQYGNEPDGVDLIAANEIRFGIIGADQVILARAGERPVVTVYSWFQKYPVGIVTPNDSGITEPADLSGRRVGVPGRFGASYIGLTALLNANGLTESDIELQEIGFNAAEVMCIGGVEAAAVYINNEPLQIAERAVQGDCGNVHDVHVIPITDYVPLASNGITTNEETILNQPELVQGMVSAFDRAVKDIIANPAEAYLLSASYIENLPLPDELQSPLEEFSSRGRLDSEARTSLLETVSAELDSEILLQFQVLLATLDLWRDSAGETGSSKLDEWEATQDTLITISFLAEPIDLEQAFTNDFVPVQE